MTIPMGVQSENNAEAVEFDVSEWLARDGSLSFSVWVTRPGETEAYQADNATLKDGVLSWWPTGADTAIAGEGKVEILAVSANRRMLSGWTATSIRETTTETTTDAPVDQRPWLDQALLASEEAKAAAASAAASADKAEGVVKKEIAALSEDIARDTAPPIIPTATGEVVTISDSANRPLAGLRLYGKTTQDGVPTPNSPAPLVNVGAGGGIKAYARGKNLLNIAAIVKADERNGVTLTSLGNGFTVQGVPTGNIAWNWALDTPIPAGKYVLQAKNIGTSETATLYFANTNGEDVGHLPLSTTYAKNTFTVDVPITRLKLYITSGATVDMRMYPILSVEDKYDYEEYKDGGFVTANTPNGLPGIPVSSGGNYTDADGQMWLSNVRDYGRGVASQQIGQTVLDTCAYYDTNRNLAYVALSYYPTRNAHLVGLSNGLVYDNLMFDRMVDGTFLLMTTVDDSWGDYLRAVVKLPAGAASNSAEAAAWLTAQNITVLYPLYQPIETPIPADELAAFRAMTSQYPHTTVYNDAGAGMQVDYIADTKNYIDNKLAAIAAATL